MERYFRLKKEIPGTIKLTDLVKLDDKGWVWKKDKNNNSAWFTTHHTKEDVEMTEYFEESVGMSSDKYVLFKGDTVYKKKIQDVIIDFQISSHLDLMFSDFYFKKENVPVNTLPKSWEDLKEIKGYFISAYSKCSEIPKADTLHENRNIFHTESQAKSALAYAQLSQLVAKMNGNWQPDFKDGNRQKKFYIMRLGDKLETQWFHCNYYPLVFKNESDRDFSLEHHASLWNQFYQIEE